MATKKDLVEAYSFSRRRLVTAFVSGAPGGREVEPARPGRTIVGGLALAVLLIAGAAIAGIFSPRAPSDWTEPGLIVSKETGEAYVITDSEDEEEDAPVVLRRVTSIVSAWLILGGETTPRIVPQEAIDEQVVGDDIGILNAPESLPTTGELVGTDWSACNADGGGIRITLAEPSPVAAEPTGSFFVRVGKAYYLVAVSAGEEDGTDRAYSFELPSDAASRENMLTALDLEFTSDDAVEVSQAWLNLFPEGAPLSWSSFGIANDGDRAPDAGTLGIPPDARIGDVLVYEEEDRFLVTDDGTAPLNDFANAIYSNLPKPHKPRDPRPLEGLPDVPRADAPFDENHWPAAFPDQLVGPPCAVLQTDDDGGPPGVLPATLLGDDSLVDASPEDVPAGQKSVEVENDHGAYVLSADWDDLNGGSPFVIDEKGKSYAMVGADMDVLLGYDGYSPPLIPDRWLELFEKGVPLSQDAALCPPTTSKDASC